jgi:hypothetical protein
MCVFLDAEWFSVCGQWVDSTDNFVFYAHSSFRERKQRTDPPYGRYGALLFDPNLGSSIAEDRGKGGKQRTLGRGRRFSFCIFIIAKISEAVKRVWRLIVYFFVNKPFFLCELCFCIRRICKIRSK